MMTATAVTRRRKRPRRVCVRSLLWLKRLGLRRAARGSMRVATSRVETIGEALGDALV